MLHFDTGVVVHLNKVKEKGMDKVSHVYDRITFSSFAKFYSTLLRQYASVACFIVL